MAEKPFDFAGQIKDLEAIAEANKQIQDSLKKTTLFREQEQKLIESGKTELQAQLEAARSTALHRENEVQLLQKSLDLLEQHQEQLLALKDLDEEAAKDAAAKLENIQSEIDHAEKLLVVTKKVADQRKLDLLALEDINAAAEGTKTVIGSLFALGERGGFVVDLFNRIERGSLTSGLVGMARGILEVLHPVNLLKTALTEAVMVHVKEQEQELSNFAEATALANEYRESLIKLSHSYVTLGIEEKQIIPAMIALRENFAGFTSLSRDAQEELTGLAAKLKVFGISSETVGKTIDILTRVSGLSVSQSMKAQTDLLGLARQIGVAPSKMASDFEHALPKLTAFGDKAVEKFKALSIAAKATGMDVDRLLSITEKFDTFDGAADAVGRLNAILGGGYLDSVRMVQTTDPTERVKLLRGALDQAGKSFDQLSYYEKKSVAAAAGMADVSELAKFMSGDIDKLTESSKEHAMSQEAINKLIKDAMPLLDKLKTFVASLGAALMPIITPIVGVLRALGDALAWIAELGHGVVLKVILALGASFLLARGALGRMFGVAKSGIDLVGKIIPSLRGWAAAQAAKNVTDQVAAVSAPAAAAAQKAQTATMATSIPTILAFGAAIFLVAAGIALASFGIATLATAIKGMTGPEFLMLSGILVGMAIGIALLGTASFAASPGLLALGLAIALIGAGLGLIFGGLALLVRSITGLFTAISENAEIVGPMAKNLVALSGALFVLLPGALVGSFAMGILSSGLLGLAFSLALIKTDDLRGLATIFEAISKISGGTVEALRGVASSIKSISAAISEIPESKMMTFGMTTKSMVEFVSASGIMGETATNNVKTLAESAVRYSGGGASAGAVPASSQASISSSTTGQNQPIILQLDGQVLKRFIIDLINKEMNPRKI